MSHHHLDHCMYGRSSWYFKLHKQKRSRCLNDSLSLSPLLLNNGGFFYRCSPSQDGCRTTGTRRTVVNRARLQQNGWKWNIKCGREGRVSLPLSWLEEMLSSSLGFATCVIMDVLSMESRCSCALGSSYFLVNITKMNTTATITTTTTVLWLLLVLLVLLVLVWTGKRELRLHHQNPIFMCKRAATAAAVPFILIQERGEASTK